MWPEPLFSNPGGVAMRWNRAVAWSLVAMCVVVAGVNLSCSSATSNTATPAAMTPEQKVARGAYLVSAGSCNDCHTPGTMYGVADSTRLLGGSELGWEGPWGVVYARNLTPHETGLGAWTDEQIATAIRTGNRPDGRMLSEMMPWKNLAHLTEEDALAIAAYLKSLAPVDHKVPDPVPPGQKVDGSVV